MTAYLLRRVVFFIPTLLVITLLSFIISQSAPGDPVEQMLSSRTQGGEQLADRQASFAEYFQKRRELGLDLPIFYFSIGPLAEPETLYKIPQIKIQDALRRLIYLHGNWEVIQEYFHGAKSLDTLAYGSAATLLGKDTLTEVRAILTVLLETQSPSAIQGHLNKLSALTKGIPLWQKALSQVREKFDAIEKRRTPWKIYVPVLFWYGTQNQFHRWLTGMLRLDFGISYQDKRPITDKLLGAVRWSLVINIISIILAYLIAIPLGIDSAVHRGSFRDRTVTTFLFLLYSLPGFWVATLGIVFLCGGDYLDLFPPGGVQSLEHSETWSLGERLLDWGYHLFLPVLVYTYGSLAFLSRQMRVAMLETLGQDFIRTARAKGLPEKKVIWRHAFRNSLIPIITLLASVFPSMISGSVILETIFSIPGMGFLSYGAMIARDYPVIIAVFTIGAVLTLIGILVADILYAVVDPRISFGKK